MQTKSIYTVGLLIFFCLNFLQSQRSIDTLALASSAEIENNILTDSIPNKEPTLLDKVKYNAKEYVRINRKESKLYLYDSAELYYQDMVLKAGIIILDYAKNEVTAGRITDSLGVLIQNPYFKQINNEILFFSHNKFNLISFYDKDHGDRDGSSLKSWVKRKLEQVGIEKKLTE